MRVSIIIVLHGKVSDFAIAFISQRSLFIYRECLSAFREPAEFPSGDLSLQPDDIMNVELYFR